MSFSLFFAFVFRPVTQLRVFGPGVHRTPSLPALAVDRVYSGLSQTTMHLAQALHLAQVGIPSTSPLISHVVPCHRLPDSLRP